MPNYSRIKFNTNKANKFRDAVEKNPSHLHEMVASDEIPKSDKARLFFAQMVKILENMRVHTKK